MICCEGPTGSYTNKRFGKKVIKPECYGRYSYGERLGFVVKASFDEGLKKTIEWYKSQGR
jgi:nucleoside-diphosphate-sugar epimerase